MAKKTRVAALFPAIATAMMELVTAIKTRIHARPQRRLASKITGGSVEEAKLSMWRLPQPVIRATAQTTKKITISPGESSTARGRVRFGFLVSSANGATDSKPVKIRMENTTATKKPFWPKLCREVKA